MGTIFSTRTTYTPSCESVPKKIKDFNSPRNEPLIVLYYWSKNIEEYFHLHNPDNINLPEKYTTQDVKNVMNRMVKHVNSMEQVMIVIQENFIESDNERVKKSIRMDQLIRENISTKKYPPNSLPYKLCTRKIKTTIRNYYKVSICTEH